MDRIDVDVADDARRYLATDDLVWFNDPLPGPAELLVGSIPADQRFAAYVDDAGPATYAAIYGVRPMTLSVPGPGAPRRVPVAGLTWVGVHPDHRRRGLLTAMLRDHLERTRDAGVALSVLHASEPAIYARHGYGPASRELEVALGRGATLTAPGLNAEAAALGTCWAGPDDDIAARVHAVEQRAAAEVVGAISGEEAFYAAICLDPPERRRGREPARAMFAVQNGVDVGHALFHRTEKWDRGRPVGTVVVRRLAGSPAARLALLRRLVDLDLTTRVEVSGVSVDDELLHWVGGPRATARVETYDSLWVRLVDLPAALVQRSWSAPCDVVVDVVDRAAPWNAGRWRVRVDRTGAAEVTRTDVDPAVRLPVDLLGAAYLGGTSLVGLHRAGLLEERRPGAVAQLSRALRTDTAPSAAIGF